MVAAVKGYRPLLVMSDDTGKPDPSIEGCLPA